MANAERDLAEDAEWKRIQENTFTRWVNEHLRQAGTSINDLETDFSNGLKLIALLEVLSGKKMPKHNKKTTFRSQKLENVSIALKFLETEGVHLVNIDSTHITDCKLKLIMGVYQPHGDRRGGLRCSVCMVGTVGSPGSGINTSTLRSPQNTGSRRCVPSVHSDAPFVACVASADESELIILRNARGRDGID